MAHGVDEMFWSRHYSVKNNRLSRITTIKPKDVRSLLEMLYSSKLII